MEEEVYRGHIAECWKHFSTNFFVRIPRGSPTAPQAKRPIADFCGVTIDSVGRWLNSDKRLPVGEQYIKLMCFLDASGYRVLELENLPATTRNFAELIGYGLLSGQQAAELLGYTAPTTLYMVIKGLEAMSQEKKGIMWEVWKVRKEELRLTKEQMQKSFCSKVSPAVKPSKPTPVAVAKPAKPSLRQIAVTAAAKELLLMLGEEITEDELDGLQVSAGVILQLTARLNELSSRLIEKKEGCNGKKN